ncbi:MAG: hypothetical protein O3A01_07085 [bacterium]|nr:hypothetical protein [bacterium]
MALPINRFVRVGLEAMGAVRHSAPSMVRPLSSRSMARVSSGAVTPNERQQWGRLWPSQPDQPAGRVGSSLASIVFQPDYGPAPVNGHVDFVGVGGLFALMQCSDYLNANPYAMVRYMGGAPSQAAIQNSSGRQLHAHPSMLGLMPVSSTAPILG